MWALAVWGRRDGARGIGVVEYLGLFLHLGLTVKVFS